MTRTQIQFPDPLYQRLKAIAEQQDRSLAGVMRKACDPIPHGSKLTTNPMSPRRIGNGLAKPPPVSATSSMPASL